MKKLILGIIITLSFATCKKFEAPEYGLTKVDIQDARIIYSIAEKSSQNERFILLDSSNNVRPVRFITTEGDSVDMTIYGIQHFNKDYLLMVGYFYLTGYNNPPTYIILVNKESGKIHPVKNCDAGLYNLINIGRQIYIDQEGYHYIVIGGSLYKCKSPSNDEVSFIPCLAENKRIGGRCMVSKDGIIYHEQGEDPDFEAFLQMPDNQEYSLSELLADRFHLDEGEMEFEHQPFLLDGSLCGILRHGTGNDRFEMLIRYGISMDNTVSIDVLQPRYPYTNLPEYNHVRQVHEIVNDEKRIIDYDLNSNCLSESGLTTSTLPGNGLIGRSLTCQWYFDENSFSAYHLTDYSKAFTINITEKGITSTLKPWSDKCHEGITFIGILASTGQYILGHVHENGEVTIHESTASDIINDFICL